MYAGNQIIFFKSRYFYLGNDDDDESSSTGEVEHQEYLVSMIVNCLNDAGGETEILESVRSIICTISSSQNFWNFVFLIQFLLLFYCINVTMIKPHEKNQKQENSLTKERQQWKTQIHHQAESLHLHSLVTLLITLWTSVGLTPEFSVEDGDVHDVDEEVKKCEEHNHWHCGTTESVWSVWSTHNY